MPKSKFRPFTIAILLILAVADTNGQTGNSKIDSLKAILTPNISDSLRLKIFRKIGIQYEPVNFDSALYYHNLTIRIAENKHWTTEKASGFVNIGFAYKYTKNDEISLVFLKKGLETYKNTNDKKGELDTYYNLGTFANSFEKFNDAIFYYKKAVKVGILLKDSVRLSMIYNNLGLVYHYVGEYQKSVENQVLALKLKEKLGDKTLAYSHVNIGLDYNLLKKSKLAKEHLYTALNLLSDKNNMEIAICYNGIGEACENEDSIKRAILYFNKAFKIYSEAKFAEGISRYYIKMGKLYLKQKNSLQANKYFKMALKTYPENGSLRLKASLLSNLAKYEFSEYQATKDKKHLENTVSYAQNFYNLGVNLSTLADINEGAKLLYTSYQILGNNKKAMKFAQIYMATTDSLFNKNKMQIIENVGAKYETEKKEQTIKNLEIEKKAQKIALKVRNYTIIGVVIFALLLIVFLFMVSKNRKKLAVKNANILHQKEQIEQEKQKTENALSQLRKLNEFKEGITSMIVHDLKNPISSMINVANQIETVEQKEVISHSAYKMLNLVMNILDVAKYEHTNLQLHKSKQNILLLWENAIKQLNYLAKQRNIHINYPEKKEIFAEVDKELIVRVFVNILSNALKYSKLNSEVLFDVQEQKNKQTKFILKDYGVGIPKESIVTLFEKYTQIGTKMDYSTGLGLIFCKIVVEAHGGQIGVESTLRKGTDIWFTLPNTTTKFLKQEILVTKKIVHFENLEVGQLLKYLPELKEKEVVQVSELRKIFKEMNANGLENNPWFQAVQQSVTTGNKDEYARLLNEFGDTETNKSTDIATSF